MVAMTIVVGDGLTHGDGTIYARYEEVFDAGPYGFDARALGELGHFGKHLVGVEEEAAAGESGCEEGGRKGVGIVGIQYGGTREDHEEEEPYVVFGVEEDFFAKQKFHAMGAVGALQREAGGQLATYQGYGVAGFVECQAGAMDALVGDEVVGDGKNDALFHVMGP